MKIFIDGRLLSKNPTGISRFTLEIIKYYTTRIPVKNIYVLINNNNQINLPEVNLIRTRLSPFNIFHILLLSLKLFSHRYHILHFTIYSAVFFTHHRSRKIVLVHDLMYRYITNYFSKNHLFNKLKVTYLDIIVKYSLRNSYKIFTISNRTYLDVKDEFNIRSEVITPGLNRIEDRNQNIDSRIENLEYDSFYFYVGNNRKQKNINFLIESYNKSTSNKKLVLAGFESTEKLNNDNIVVLGEISDANLKILYVKCFAFVLPSLYEGFGMPVLEAMNSKCRIICSNTGALSEFQRAKLNFFDPYKQSTLQFYFNNETQLIYLPDSYNFYLKKYTWKSYRNQLDHHLSEFF
jgi:glycosyltransferase involved in cell wall biosynthesis